MHRLALALLLSLSACATVEVGREFDLSAFDKKVQRGVSTQADVRAWLGAPASVGVTRLDLLQVKFDDRGVVRAYNWSGERK